MPLDEAFDLLEQAKALEALHLNQDDPPPPPNQEQPTPTWAVLEQSAAKYNEACFVMKDHIKTLSKSSQSTSEQVVMTKKLLIKQMTDYEDHADKLLGKVKELKIEDEDKQQKQKVSKAVQNSARESGELGGSHSERSNTATSNVKKNFSHSTNSTSSWEAKHGTHLHHSFSGKRDDNQPSQRSVHPSQQELETTKHVDKANRLLSCALDHDERGEATLAIDYYMQALQNFSLAIKSLSTVGSGGTPSGESPLQQYSESPTSKLESLRRKEEMALKRVQKLKHILLNPPSGGSGSDRVGESVQAPPQPSSHGSSHRPNNTNQSEKLTQYEIEVLKRSSHITSGVFLPWSDDEALQFNKSPTQTWLDPTDDGKLPLSDKQVERGCRWARPADIVSMRRNSCKIAMIKSITPYTIKQHCVSDCSFIAGLCISAAFERRFNRRLVSSLIYPQDPTKGMPMYNPHGVYMVKLWLNGVARRVIIDDQLPVDSRGKLLCSHTTNANVLELWVPLLEKAYMKLCGGYNFPGSNSGVDLFCLTGWIPERIFFPEDRTKVKDFETPVERAWERLYSANSYGDCLITVSTSKDLTDEQAEGVGLFTGHAYAVLGVVKTSNGTRLLQLKNPWASKGWRGRFSSMDKESWSDPNFCAEVGYDAKEASQCDDGVFWMSWDDILLYFRNIHMSWSTDPALFGCRTTVHGFWPKSMGPTDDSFNVGENPQYTVTLSERAIKTKATLWLLLSRHVTKQEQEGGEVRDYLTLHIHQIKHAKQRVWYPSSKCILTGAYTNNQHVLIRYDVAGPEDRFLSLVLSQYQKSNDLSYTLACYCTQEFTLGHTEPFLGICQELKGSWKLWDSLTERSSLAVGTAGGPPGKGSFGSNPQWSIMVPPQGARMQVKCLAPKDLPINLILARSRPGGSQNGDEQRIIRMHHLYEEPAIDTGDYRYGFVVSEIIAVPCGMYTLVPNTFEPGQEGNFMLHVLSSKELRISEIDC